MVEEYKLEKEKEAIAEAIDQAARGVGGTGSVEVNGSYEGAGINEVSMNDNIDKLI